MSKIIMYCSFVLISSLVLGFDGMNTTPPDHPLHPYNFGYKVLDASGIDQGHQESSDGKTITGSYRVLLPDGRIQVVHYTADASGFRPNITYEQGPISVPPPTVASSSKGPSGSAVTLGPVSSNDAPDETDATDATDATDVTDAAGPSQQNSEVDYQDNNN